MSISDTPNGLAARSDHDDSTPLIFDDSAAVSRVIDLLCTAAEGLREQLHEATDDGCSQALDSTPISSHSVVKVSPLRSREQNGPPVRPTVNSKLFVNGHLKSSSIVATRPSPLKKILTTKVEPSFLSSAPPRSLSLQRVDRVEPPQPTSATLPDAEKLYSCGTCGQKFGRPSTLRRHEQTVHQGRRYLCQLCHKLFTQSGHLRKHQLAVHEGQRHKCVFCSKTFSYMADLRRHAFSAHEGRSLSCSMCNKTYAHVSSLRSHQSAAHGVGGNFHCQECGTTFTRADNLKRHESTVHDVDRFQCADCDQSFIWAKDLRRHRAFVHERHRFCCPHCDKSFSQMGHVRVHIRSSHEGVRFSCGCGKTFAHLPSLRRHEKQCCLSTGSFTTQKLAPVGTNSTCHSSGSPSPAPSLGSAANQTTANQAAASPVSTTQPSLP